MGAVLVAVATFKIRADELISLVRYEIFKSAIADFSVRYQFDGAGSTGTARDPCAIDTDVFDIKAPFFVLLRDHVEYEKLLSFIEIQQDV